MSDGKSKMKISAIRPTAAKATLLPTATACLASFGGMFSAFCSAGISVGIILTSVTENILPTC